MAFCHTPFLHLQYQFCDLKCQTYGREHMPPLGLKRAMSTISAIFGQFHRCAIFDFISRYVKVKPATIIYKIRKILQFWKHGFKTTYIYIKNIKSDQKRNMQYFCSWVYKCLRACFNQFFVHKLSYVLQICFVWVKPPLYAEIAFLPM